MITLFDYKLTGVGWAEMTFGVKDKWVAIPVSYTCDPLTDLIGALLRLLRQETQFEIINLDGETIQHDLLLTIIKTNILKIDLIEEAYFEVYEPDLNERTPETIFLGYDNLLCFAHMVAKKMQVLLHETGEEKYIEKWLEPFPKKELDELENWFRQSVRGRNV